MKKIILLYFIFSTCLINSQTVIPFGQRIPEYYYWDSNWYDWPYIQNPNSALDYYPYMRALTEYLHPSADIFVGRRCITNSPMKIIGIAAPVTTTPFPERIFDTIMEHRIPEYFRLYDENDSGFVLLTEAQWDTVSRYKMCFLNESNTEMFDVKEAYFNQPIIVSDTFYVGGTTHNSHINYQNDEIPLPYIY
ncbi:MAG: hypothetical protein IJR26_03310 [Bacteroidales bacterium]|nr:hypothetical protein [Bacteroidales bacterium]